MENNELEYILDLIENTKIILLDNDNNLFTIEEIVELLDNLSEEIEGLRSKEN